MKRFITATKIIMLSSCMLSSCNLFKKAPHENKSSFQNYQVVSLKKMKNDTLQYIQQNFINHKDLFVDKDLNTFSDALGISIQYYCPAFASGTSIDTKGIYLSFVNKTDYHKISDIGKSPLTIYVEFKNNLPGREVLNLQKNHPSLSWTSAEKSFFSSQIVTDLAIVKKRFYISLDAIVDIIN